MSEIRIEKYSSSTCIPCKAYKNTMDIFKFNNPEVEVEEIEDAPERFSAAGIRSVPTTIFYKDGVEKCRFSGALNMSTLEEKIKELKSTE